MVVLYPQVFVSMYSVRSKNDQRCVSSIISISTLTALSPPLIKTHGTTGVHGFLLVTQVLNIHVQASEYVTSRLIRLSCSDGVASPSEWLLNPARSARAPKALGPHPDMRWQNSGENPEENCWGEHLNVLRALLLGGKHLRGGSKPTPTDSHLTQLCVGVRADSNFALFNRQVCLYWGGGGGSKV